MQPRSIKLFTILFVLANAVAIAGDFAFWDRHLTIDVSDSDAEIPIETEVLMTNLLLGLFAAVYGVMLLLWYLITQKRSQIAKWVLVAVTALIAVAMWIPTDEFRVDEVLVYGTANLLQILAVAMLFRADAKKWFDRIGDVDPEAFS